MPADSLFTALLGFPAVRLRRGGEWGAVRGGGGGAATSIHLQPGDTVVGVAGRTDGRLVTQLQFTTAAGVTLGPVGAGAGQVSCNSCRGIGTG